MRRVVSVWFPTLPTDRIGPPGPEAGPLVTVADDRASRVLAAVNDAAAALGLRPGMKLAQARILAADLAVRDADPAGDAAELRRLAEWALRYAPLAAPDPPDGLWIDVTGSAHLKGGEARLQRDLVQRLAARGLGCRAAAADTPAVAHAVARYGSDIVAVVPPGAEVLSGFPIEALRLPLPMAEGLRLLGFDQVGALAAAARAPLVRRFGAELARRLDQAAGRVFEPIEPIVPATLAQASRGFIEPLLTAEAFANVIGHLVPEVCDELERAGQGARRLDLLFRRTDGSVQAIRAGTARPVREPRHLARMLTERLERIDPGLGVEAMRLVVAVADPLGPVQAASALTETASADIAPLIDLLANRLGEARVYRVAPVESHVPERSQRRVPALAPEEASGAATWPADLPRPVRLLHPPQPVEAMALLPDDPPVAFTWRRVRHRVRRADGPERIAGEWWKHDREKAAVRDYFQVEDEHGRRFWLFRRGNGSDPGTGDMRWFLHGFF